MQAESSRPKREKRPAKGAAPKSRKTCVLIGCLAAAVLLLGYCALCAVGDGETIYPNVTV